MDTFRDLKMLITSTIASVPLEQFRATLENLSSEQRTILQSTGMTASMITRSVGVCPFRLKVYLENGFGYNHVHALIDQAIALDNPHLIEVLLEDSVIRSRVTPLEILRSAGFRVRLHLLDDPSITIGADDFMTLVPYLSADAMRDILTHRRMWHIVRALPDPIEWADKVLQEVCDAKDMSMYTFDAIKRACKYHQYITLQSILREIA